MPLPYPNERWTWPNFQSPLLWDAMAIFTYLSSSVIFLYVGMIPDLAICRDHLHPGWRKKLYTLLALGWEGTDRQWRNFRVTYLTVACFLIPLAVSVHSIVASDFAMSQQPGWHVTSFPPYFVAGALYSGCAAIITLFIILRYVFKFEEYMTLPILKKTVRLTFAIAMVWTYLNCIEFASVWYSHDQVAKDVLIQKATGTYAPFWWAMIFCGSVVAVRHDVQALPDQHSGDVRRVHIAESGYVAGTLDDRVADFFARLLPVDMGSRSVAKSGPVGHRIRQLRLVHLAVHDLLQSVPVRFHVRGQGDGLPPQFGFEEGRTC